METRVSRSNSSTLFGRSPSPSFSEQSHDNDLIDIFSNNPSIFIKHLKAQYDWRSMDTAKLLDSIDTSWSSRHEFDLKMTSWFTSISPRFIPAEKAISAAIFHGKNIEKNFNDDYKTCVEIMKKILGYSEASEFNLSASGFSQNLTMLINAFYRPVKNDWEIGRTLIVMPESEFDLYGKEVQEFLRQAIEIANDYGCFSDAQKPDANSLLLVTKNNNTELVDAINSFAGKIQMIFLSDMIMRSGENLELNEIFDETEKNIKKFNIKVSLNLGNSLGQQKFDLKRLPVTFAFGLIGKNLHGINDDLCGIYINKSSNKSLVISLPSSIQLAPLHSFLTWFDESGFDNYFNKMICVADYFISLLNENLKDKISIVNSGSSRDHKIMFKIKNLPDVNFIKNYMQIELPHKGRYELDVMYSDIFCLHMHYGYTSFRDIFRFVDKLKFAIYQIPNINKLMEFSIIELDKKFYFDWAKSSTIEPCQAMIRHVEVVIDKVYLSEFASIADKQAYAFLNYKLGTFYTQIDENPELALPRLYIAEKYFSAKPEYLVELVFTKNHIIYAYKQLTAALKMDKDLEQSLEVADQYKCLALRQANDVITIFTNLKKEWVRNNPVSWIRIDGYAQYVVALLNYEVSVTYMIVDGYNPEPEKDLLVAYEDIYATYKKYSIMDDSIAVFKNKYATLLSRNNDCVKAEPIFKSLELYWSKTTEDNLYKKRFNDSFAIFNCKVRTTVSEDMVKRERSGSKSKEILGKFISSSDNHKHHSSSSEHSDSKKTSPRRKISADKRGDTSSRKFSF